MAHSVDSLGVAYDALAAQVADHGDAISALASAPPSPSEAASQPRTFVIGAQGVVIGEMRYVGAWDAFTGFLTQDVVRFAKATWACISPTKEPTEKLGPLPAGLLAKITGNAASVLRGLEPGELKEDVIEITDPTYKKTATFLGQCKIYQVLGNGKKAVVTNPNPFPAESFVHTYLFNEAGEEKLFESWAGEGASIETEVLGAGKKFWLVYQMTNKAGGEVAEPSLPSTTPRVINVKATETKALVGGNKNPSEDTAHWVKIAEAVPAATSLAISAPIAAGTERAKSTPFLVSATKEGLVVLHFKPEKEKEALIDILVGGASIFGGKLPKIGNLTEAQGESLVVTFPVPAGKEWEWTAGVGEVKRATSTYYTLN